MKKAIALAVLIVMVAIGLYASEPIISKVHFRAASVEPHLMTTQQCVRKAQGVQVIDTITVTTLDSLSYIPWIAMAVTDTMESENDTALVKIYAGSTLLLQKSTAQFKLPGGFRWDVNKIASGAITIQYTRANITEGTGYWFIPYMTRNP